MPVCALVPPRGTRRVVTGYESHAMGGVHLSRPCRGRACKVRVDLRASECVGEEEKASDELAARETKLPTVGRSVYCSE